MRKNINKYTPMINKNEYTPLYFIAKKRKQTVIKYSFS